MAKKKAKAAKKAVKKTAKKVAKKTPKKSAAAQSSASKKSKVSKKAPAKTKKVAAKKVASTKPSDKLAAKVKAVKKADVPVPAPTVEASAKVSSVKPKKTIQRPKTLTRAGADSPKAAKAAKSAALTDPANKLLSKWSSLYKKAGAKKPVPYSMRETFEAKTPIMHKVLGWGFILDNKNDRLEVLFKDGIRFLISNYKS